MGSVPCSNRYIHFYRANFISVVILFIIVFFELVAVFLNGRKYAYRKGKSESLVAYDIVSFTHLGPMFPSYRNQSNGLQ